MKFGRQLRLFLADGTSSGPRYYEIVNRTIQALAIPVIRVQEVATSDWHEFQKPGVYLVRSSNSDGTESLYVGKGENISRRIQNRFDDPDEEVTSLLLFSSKDQNLNGSQVGWLESRLIKALAAAKRIATKNIQTPEEPALSKAELATVAEFFEDLILIAQTSGFDFFTSDPPPAENVFPSALSSPIQPVVDFTLEIRQKGIIAKGHLSDDGFVVKAGSTASAVANSGLGAGYGELREKLKHQGVLIPDSNDINKLRFAVDYSFTASSPAAAIIVGYNYSGPRRWKTDAGISLGDYMKSVTSDLRNPSPPL